MILYTREFTVNGQKITVGHDRESGKRYIVQEVVSIEIGGDDMNEIFVSGVSVDQTTRKCAKSVADKYRSIFWIE